VGSNVGASATTPLPNTFSTGKVGMEVFSVSTACDVGMLAGASATTPLPNTFITGEVGIEVLSASTACDVGALVGGSSITPCPKMFAMFAVGVKVSSTACEVGTFVAGSSILAPPPLEASTFSVGAGVNAAVVCATGMGLGILVGGEFDSSSSFLASIACEVGTFVTGSSILAPPPLEARTFSVGAGVKAAVVCATGMEIGIMVGGEFDSSSLNISFMALKASIVSALS